MNTSEYIQDFLSKCRSGAVEPSLVEDAIGVVYRSIAKEPPTKIVWCNGPLEVQLLPRLASLMAHCSQVSQERWIARIQNLHGPQQRTMSQRLSAWMSPNPVSGALRRAAEASPNLAPIIARFPQLSKVGCVGSSLMAAFSSRIMRKLVPALADRAEEKSGLSTTKHLSTMFQAGPGRYFHSSRISYSVLFRAVPALQVNPAEFTYDCQCDRNRMFADLEQALGCWETYFLGAYDWHRQNYSYGDDNQFELDRELSAWITLTTGAFGYHFFEETCFVIAHPKNISIDQLSRWHCETGPSVEFANGEKGYNWNGISVPEALITNRKKLSPFWIDRTPNAELRRVMIEIYGWEKYLKKSGAKLVHEDDCGKLYRKEVAESEAIQAVEVVNKTPEPDGSLQKYLLRVPPEIQTAKAAVAWTFGLTKSQYELTMET